MNYDLYLKPYKIGCDQLYAIIINNVSSRLHYDHLKSIICDNNLYVNTIDTRFSSIICDYN